MRKWNWKQLFNKRKIHISWLWILFLLCAIYTNTFKTLCFIFLMLSVHESMHIIIGKIFSYPIEKVIVYPFGICAQMEYLGYGDVGKELLIILAGPSVHLIFPFFFQWLASISYISMGYCEYLQMLNMSILIFNILPIYPLDGGRIIQSLTHMILPYRKAQIFTLLISTINLFLLFHYRFLNGINGFIILIFLGFQIWFGFQQLTLSQLSFYHYRYLHPVDKKDKLNQGNDLYRARHNIMRRGTGWMSEQQWLSLYFHKQKPKANRRDCII